MLQLPEEKAPRVDSDGEKYRELQLVYQLPKQGPRGASLPPPGRCGRKGLLQGLRARPR